MSAQTASSSAESRLSSGSSNSVSTGSTLIHSVIKSLQKSYINQSKSLIIPKYAFALLTNCAQSSECKNIIWKASLSDYDLKSSLLDMFLFEKNFKHLRAIWFKILPMWTFKQLNQTQRNVISKKRNFG